MSASEARYFLQTCTDEIEAGMTAGLRRRIRAAYEIVVADDAGRRAADLARRAQTIHAARQAREEL